MKFHNSVVIFIGILIAVSFIFMGAKFIYAQTSTRIDATVKLSICGNLVADGEEECDRSDLRGRTCQSLGYSGGTLTCDISCSYDVYSCTVTAANVLAPTTVPSSEATQVSPSEGPFSPSSAAFDAEVKTAPRFKKEQTLRTNALPAVLRAYDLTGSGRIGLEDLYAVVKMWVEDWGKPNENEARQCDVNADKSCTLEDLSILLFYVER